MALLDSSSDDEQEEVEVGASNGVSQGVPDRSNSSNVIVNNSSLVEADPASLQNFLPIPVISSLMLVHPPVPSRDML